MDFFFNLITGKTKDNMILWFFKFCLTLWNSIGLYCILLDSIEFYWDLLTERESYLFYGGNQRKRWLFSLLLNCFCVLIGITTNACSHHQLFPNHLFCCYWKVLSIQYLNKIVRNKKSNRYNSFPVLFYYVSG